MDELQVALNIALANTFAMYFKAHSYHWNVEGPLFPQYHTFFGDVYNELHSAVDPFAEQIRTIGGYGPISLVGIARYATVVEDADRPRDVAEMVSRMTIANDLTIVSLNKALSYAQHAQNQGLMDFIASRLDSHAKHGWMLKASAKSTGAQ